MEYSHKHSSRGSIKKITLHIFIFIGCLVISNWIYASDDATPVIELELSDYRFSPREIQLSTNQSAILRLVNTDSVTPHNFIMETGNDSPIVEVDLLGGETVEVKLPPLPAGRYTFYCSNKLLFMKSHREKGMEGILIVNPE
jgi:plastocyanin